MSLRRLIGPVILALLLSAVAFSWMVLSIASTLDKDAANRQSQVVLEKLAKWHQNNAVLAEDNAWWDQAVENIIFQENMDWIEANIGQSVVGINELSAMFVIRPDMSVLYEKSGDTIPSATAFIAEETFSSPLRSLPVANAQAPSTTSGFVVLENKLFAFGASRVVEAGDSPLSKAYAGGQTPFIVFLSHIDATKVTLDGDQISAEDLQFAQTPIGGDFLSAPVTALSGDTLGYLNWKPDTPGSDALAALAMPSGIFLAFIIALVWLFYRRAQGVILQLRTDDRAKSQFLASVSHDIRTPLNSILGFADLVSSELFGKVEGAKNKEYLRIVKESGNQLLTTFDDILAISKMDAGKFDIELYEVETKAAIAHAIEVLRSSATQKQIGIKELIEPGLIYSDERIMRQILMNIVANAIKYEPERGLILIKGYSDGDFYIVTVSDNGPGMTKREIMTALSLFGKVGINEYAASEGTGLGLPLVQRFLKLLGGDIAIHSEPGKGTEVQLKFPIAEPQIKGTYRRPASQPVSGTPA